MNAKQRDRHERKMYLKGLRYGARYEVITTPAIRELIVNKKKNTQTADLALARHRRIPFAHG